MKMEEICSSETSVDFLSARNPCVPEERILNRKGTRKKIKETKGQQGELNNLFVDILTPI
jgi:hypothetical protein